MDREMNAQEIVKALKGVAGLCRETHEVSMQSELCSQAADLIDSLVAELAPFQSAAAEYGIDAKTMLTLAKSQIATAKENAELREKINRVHDALNFADRQRNKATNYGELAVSNGLALGRIAVLIKHDYNGLPDPPQKGE